MPNDLKLQEGHPLDENIRPIKIGGKTSPLEMSDTDVRVNNLLVNGTTTGVSASDDTKLPLAGGTMTGNIDKSGTLKIEGDNATDIELASGNATPRVALLDNSNNIASRWESDGTSSSLKLFEAGGTPSVDNMTLNTTTNGVSTISTNDGAGEAADLTLDVDVDIALDSHTGIFPKKHSVTTFVPSMYAGMILGFTEIFDDSISGEDTFQSTTTSFVNLSLTQGGGEKYLKVAFVVPPSNKVLIKVHLPACANCDGMLHLGLATDTSATTLHEDYERRAWEVDETDIVGIFYQWVVHGSDHSWSAGESKTLYAMVKEGTAGGKIFSGDGSLANYGAWTMEAVALPATIGDGS